MAKKIFLFLAVGAILTAPVLTYAAPLIQVLPNGLDFGAGATVNTITIKNIGDGILTFTIIPQPTTWLNITPADLSGALFANAEKAFTFTISRTGLTPGMSYSNNLSITSNGGAAVSPIIKMSVPVAGTPPTGTAAGNEPMIPSGMTICEITHNIRGCSAKMQNPENALPCATNPAACTDCSRKAGANSCAAEICCILDKILIIADWIFVILLVVAALFIIWGAFSFVLSGGDAEKVTSARNKIIWALIGIVVAFLSQGVVRLIVQIIAK
ncbi:MAG: pilin [Patescibacteria group bacterium]